MARAPRYGYAYEAGQLVTVEHERAVVARIQELRAQHESFATIAGRLNTEGIFFRGKFWNASTVRQLMLYEQEGE